MACKLCVAGNLWRSSRYGCVQGRKVASGLNAVVVWFHRRRRDFELPDAFALTPCAEFRLTTTPEPG